MAWYLTLEKYTTGQLEDIAAHVGVSLRTLQRWVKGQSLSRIDEATLSSLLKALPKEDQANFRQQLIKEFPAMFSRPDKDQDAPPAIFYELTVRNLLTLPAILQDSTIEFILQQAVKHIDPDRIGLILQVFVCQKQDDGRIRSLLQRWRTQGAMVLSSASAFHSIGLDTLPVRAIQQYQAVETTRSEDLRQLGLEPFVQVARAYPLVRGAGLCAGAVVVSSPQPEFLAENRQKLIQSYLDLIALTLDSADFFEANMFAFSPLPSPKVQEECMRLLQTWIAQGATAEEAENQILRLLRTGKASCEEERRGGV